MLSNRRTVRTIGASHLSFPRVGRSVSSALLLATCLQGSFEAYGQRHHVVRESYLMGTKASLVIYAKDRESGLSRLEEFLEIMERTEAELTNWRKDSTISRFNLSPLGEDFPLAPNICQLFGKLVNLHKLSDGSFDPAVGRLLKVWGVHGSATIPTSAELERARVDSGLYHLSFSPNECWATKRENILLDSGAFGKGEALDRVRAHSSGHIDPWLINLGGQIAVHGLPPDGDSWQVDISSVVDRERSYKTLNLARGSLATSGDSERGSHILDPRTGRPSLFSGSVTVWHEDALVADALSTALHVMGPEDGIEWADLHGIAVCFISVAESGRARFRHNRFFDPLVSP